MNVEIRAEAAQFPEKEYLNGIAVAVQQGVDCSVESADFQFAELICEQSTFEIGQYQDVTTTIIIVVDLMWFPLLPDLDVRRPARSSGRGT